MIAAGERHLGRGTWRVYFNAHSAAPRVWCVSSADGDHWELAVTGVIVQTPARSVYRAAPPPELEGGRDHDEPRAWVEADGDLVLTSAGVAYIREAA